jgi:hypothetical protein
MDVRPKRQTSPLNAMSTETPPPFFQGVRM